VGTYLTTTYMYCLLAQLHANNYTADVYLEVFDGYSWTDVKFSVYWLNYMQITTQQKYTLKSLTGTPGLM